MSTLDRTSVGPTEAALRPNDVVAQGDICCEIDPASAHPHGVMSGAARAARAGAGLLFLALAGFLATRELPGEIALWPLALWPAWFGISHLFAAQMGYRGCPELGAIPSVFAGRRIETGCVPWERADRWLGRR